MAAYQRRLNLLSFPNYSHEIDVELLTFVERYATNLTRWDLLLYFGQDPTISDSVDDIADCLGRFAQSIQKELDDLAYLGVLRRRANGQGKVYELSNVPNMRRTVLRLAQQCCASTGQS